MLATRALPLVRRTMASTMEFDPAYIQNVQAQYAQTLDAAIKLGLGAVGLEVGSKVIYFVYDKVRKAWKHQGQAASINTDTPASEFSPLQQRCLDERSAEVTPEEAGWAGLTNDVVQQPQQAQVAVYN